MSTLRSRVRTPSAGRVAQRRAGRAICLALALGLAGAGPLPAGADEATRDAMRTILAAMARLVRLSADRQAFASPDNAAAITQALADVSDQAALLAEHTGPDDTGGEFLARSLDRYALWAKLGYERGQLDLARTLVQEAPDICVACHTRWPSAADAREKASLLSSAVSSPLPLQERARLLVASRQFAAALEALESLLASPAATPTDVEAIKLYLLVTMRVKQDYARAARTLDRFRDRAVITPELRGIAGRWIEDLRELADSPPEPGNLVSAEQWVERAGNSARYPRDGEALVAWIAASGLLHQHLTRNASASAAQVAEVNYLIGLTETRIAPDAWLPQAELYLEKAIRADPSSSSARAAYEMLEARVRAAYRGPDGDDLPDDVADHLERLKALIDTPAARGGKPRTSEV